MGALSLAKGRCGRGVPTSGVANQDAPETAQGAGSMDQENQRQLRTVGGWSAGINGVAGAEHRSDRDNEVVGAQASMVIVQHRSDPTVTIHVSECIAPCVASSGGAAVEVSQVMAAAVLGRLIEPAAAEGKGHAQQMRTGIELLERRLPGLGRGANPLQQRPLPLVPPSLARTEHPAGGVHQQ